MIIIKAIRNFIIAFASAACIYSLVSSVYAMLNFMKSQEAELNIYENYFPKGPPFSNVKLSQGFLLIGGISLAIVVFFWAFVAANKLWPIKDRKNKE